VTTCCGSAADGTALALSFGVDIQRAPRKKTGRNVLIAAGALSLIVVTVALARLRPAAPTVERASLLFGTVKRGPLVREVHGPGQLKPEQIQHVAPVTGGRVDRVLVRNGATVLANTVLLEMSNPDVELQALTAEQQLGAAQAALVSLRTSLETQRLNQQAIVANMRTQLRDAERQSASAETLAQRNLIAGNEVARQRDQVVEFRARLQIEQQRLELMTATVDSQLTLQREQITRLRAISDYNKVRVASMRVTAGADGVVQNLTLQSGQWVQSGTELAQVLQPGRLKAELKIPETQARDLALGQSTVVDTRIGLVPGHVIRIDPQATNGTVTVDVSLEGALPQGVRPDLQVDGTVQLERLADVLQVGRPAYGQPNAATGIFRLTDGGRYAERVNVRFGRASVNDIEVTGGLAAGEEIILSDMTRWDNVDRVRIK
jgi:multidrug efflux pump subunit AcrA (membrane-fusion protein)